MEDGAKINSTSIRASIYACQSLAHRRALSEWVQSDDRPMKAREFLGRMGHFDSTGKKYSGPRS